MRRGSAGHRKPEVAGDQRVDATASAGAGDAREAADGFLGKIRRQIRDHQEPVRFGQLARLRVVVVDRLELVAQVLLDDRLHVLGQVRQPLVDVLGLRPDPPADERLVVVGQVHEDGEVVA